MKEITLTEKGKIYNDLRNAYYNNVDEYPVTAYAIEKAMELYVDTMSEQDKLSFNDEIGVDYFII
jgi:hypothetical protein